MIRQLCPHCFASVELPPDAAGRDAPCPKCGKPIAVPAAYAPSVAVSGGLQNLGPTSPNSPLPKPPGTNPMSEPIAPPPGLNTPAMAPPPLAPMPTAPPPTSGPCTCGFTLNPVWLDWIPVACFTLILGLTLFSWIGIYPGGVRIYSQNPWYALAGEFSTNTLPDDMTPDEKYFETNVSGNRWLLAYFPVLFAALLLGWIDRIVRNPTVTNMPGPLAWVPSIWPRRFLVLKLISLALLVLIVVQTWRGFGLETALKQKVAEKYAEQVEKADTTQKKQKVAVAMGSELASYQLQGTTPLNVAIGAHVLAFLAMTGRWWLHNRGAKPLPRISVTC